MASGRVPNTTITFVFFKFFLCITASLSYRQNLLRVRINGTISKLLLQNHVTKCI